MKSIIKELALDVAIVAAFFAIVVFISWFFAIDLVKVLLVSICVLTAGALIMGGASFD